MCSRWSRGWSMGEYVNGTRHISMFDISYPSPVPSFVFATAQAIRRDFGNPSMSG